MFIHNYPDRAISKSLSIFQMETERKTIGFPFHLCTKAVVRLSRESVLV